MMVLRALERRQTSGLETKTSPNGNVHIGNDRCGVPSTHNPTCLYLEDCRFGWNPQERERETNWLYKPHYFEVSQKRLHGLSMSSYCLCAGVVGVCVCAGEDSWCISAWDSMHHMPTGNQMETTKLISHCTQKAQWPTCTP